jgi:hypothetical protein
MHLPAPALTSCPVLSLRPRLLPPTSSPAHAPTHPQGRTYLCKKLDLDSRVAVVRPADVKYYTK